MDPISRAQSSPFKSDFKGGFFCLLFMAWFPESQWIYLLNSWAQKKKCLRSILVNIMKVFQIYIISQDGIIHKFLKEAIFTTSSWRLYGRIVKDFCPVSLPIPCFSKIIVDQLKKELRVLHDQFFLFLLLLLNELINECPK